MAFEALALPGSGLKMYPRTWDLRILDLPVSITAGANISQFLKMNHHIDSESYWFCFSVAPWIKQVQLTAECRLIFIHLKAESMNYPLYEIFTGPLTEIKSPCFHVSLVPKKFITTTPSCENIAITTNCWTIIDRKALELTKKDIQHPKTKEKPQWDGRRGTITSKIKSHNCCVCDLQTGERLYHRTPPTGVMVLSPTSGFPTWGSGNGRRNS